jgi:hypothetical protein
MSEDLKAKIFGEGINTIKNNSRYKKTIICKIISNLFLKKKENMVGRVKIKYKTMSIKKKH